MPSTRQLAAIIMAAAIPVYLPIARFDGNPRTKSKVHRVPEATEVLAIVIQDTPPGGPPPEDDWGYDPDLPTLCGECGHELPAGRLIALHEALGHLTLADVDEWGEEGMAA